MSVENQAGDSPHEGVSQQPTDQTTTAVQDNASMSDDVKLTLEDETISSGETDEVTESSSFSPKDEAPSAARRWFESLPAKERVSTMGFVDGPFLGALLELASWSTATNDSQAADQQGFVDNRINWSASVSMNTIYAIFDNNANNANEAVKARSVEVQLMNVEAQDLLSTPNDTKSEKLDAEDIESNAIRIRAEIEEETSAGLNDAGRENSMRSLGAIFDHICVVLPAAFKHVSEAGLDQRIPYVTFSPSFLGDQASEELLSAFDVAACSAFGVPFLQCPSSSEASRSYLLTILQRLSLRNETLTKKTKLPLGVLLLARFELAVLEVFDKQGQDGVSGKVLSFVGSDLSSRPSSNEEGSLLHDGSKEQLNVSKEQTVASRRREFSLDLFVDVVSHAQAMDDLAVAIDYETLKKIMAPFVAICFTEETDSSFAKLENLFLTPLVWLLGAKDKNNGVAFGAWNTALQSALAQMGRHGSSDEASSGVPAPSSQAAVQDVLLHSYVASGAVTTHKATGVAPVAFQKKKRKSRHQRRRRKISNADTLASATTQASAATLISATTLASTTNSPDASPDIMTEHVVELNEVGPDPVQGPTVVETTTANPKSETEAISDDFLVMKETVAALEASGSGESSSIKSDLSIEENAPTYKTSVPVTSDLSVPQVVGLVVRGRPLSDQLPTISTSKSSSAELELTVEHGDAWETVEIRQRSNRKKTVERSKFLGSRKGHHFSHSTLSFGEAHGQHSAKRGKGTRHVAQRKKNGNKKMTKDILSSILDRVDDEVRKKKPSPPQHQFSQNSWNNGSPFVMAASNIGKEFTAGTKENTLRDTILGKEVGPSVKTGTPVNSRIDKGRLSGAPKPTSSPRKTSLTLRSHRQILSPADQSTAPTYQETVSAASMSSNIASALKSGLSNRDSKSLSEATDEVPQKKGRVPSPLVKQPSHAPPLPTLLSPNVVSSANSSVASSLEVPHTTRRHHSNSSADVNDVGYHLLGVCDRLSRDMSLFMSRRALALNIKRRERGALLTVLQETVSGIWPGRCHVELYGSCATQLDLPSSDLDVVVRGMDPRREAMMSAAPTPQSVSQSMSFGSELITVSHSMGESDDKQQRAQPHQISASSFIPMSMHMNGERVRRLAATLEQQPWAVQVNAIPMASVPVVKVLADPSKLSGLPITIKHQPAAQSAVVSSQAPVSSEDPSSGVRPSAQQPFPPPHQPWRGADVMNGLLSLDITFEGPEHGGIGSTEFSAHLVAEFCHETGLMPDATPFVQVLMVLKELLAQKKLNEPYSGGLSSYAILLLLVALVRERALIREEIERIEMQRKAVAAGDVSAFVGSPVASVDQSRKPTGHAWGQQAKEGIADKTTATAGGKSKQSKSARRPVTATQRIPPAHSSSWASITKKASTTEDSKQQTPKTAHKTNGKAPSCADALANSHHATSGMHNAATNGAPNAGKKGNGTDPASKAIEPFIFSPAAPNERPKPGVASSLDTLSFPPQGYNDVIEVLCTGETTAGKLLMHFLLYYGQHFDAQGTAIDVSGRHERPFSGQYSPYSHLSSYIQRRSAGSIDPITGMLTIDPIVIFDPLEGAENNNVARRCFAWNSIRWIFAQSYSTLSSAAERSATPPASPVGSGKTNIAGAGGVEMDTSAAACDPDGVCDLLDPSSPLLRCLLSF